MYATRTVRVGSTEDNEGGTYTNGFLCTRERELQRGGAQSRLGTNAPLVVSWKVEQDVPDRINGRVNDARARDGEHRAGRVGR